jgi:hypothetical protein
MVLLFAFALQTDFVPPERIFSEAKPAIFDLTHAAEAPSCARDCLNQRRHFLKALCTEASVTPFGRSAI